MREYAAASKKIKNSGRNADAYRPRSVALELIGRHRRDGRAPATFVGNPVKRVLGRVLAIRPEAAPVQTIRKKKLKIHQHPAPPKEINQRHQAADSAPGTSQVDSGVRCGSTMSQPGNVRTPPIERRSL